MEQQPNVDRSKSAFRKDESDSQSPLNFIVEKIDDWFRGQIPMESLKSLPRHYLYTIGLLLQLCMFTIFAIFLLVGYFTNISIPFISLSSNSGNCKPVAKAFSGTYIASTDGYWSGNQNFRTNKGVYYITFNNMEVDQKGFVDFMDIIQHHIIPPIANQSVNSQLPINILYWMNYAESIVVGNFEQTFEFTGEPTVVFNTLYTQAGVANIGAICDIYPTVQFNPALGNVLLTYSYTEFSEDHQCNSVLAPPLFGYTPNYDKDMFYISFDFVSFSVAIANNLNITSFDRLSVVSDATIEQTFLGSIYTMQLMYDERFPGMTPIVCITNATGDTIYPILLHKCFISISGVTIRIAYPVINNYRRDCDCNPLNDGTYGGPSPECDSFDILTSIIVYDNIYINFYEYYSENHLSQNTAIFNLVIGYSDLYQLNNDAKNAQLYSLGYNADTGYEGIYNTSFDFCSGCSMVSLDSFANNGVQAVSDYYYQVTNGNCGDSFSISNEAFEKLKNNPPTTLTESYFECYPRAKDTLLNAVGIATGNTSAIFPLFLLLILPIMYFFLNQIRAVPPPTLYNPEERDQVLKELADYILLIRDGKPIGVATAPTLRSLADEMVSLANGDAQATEDINQLVRRLRRTSILSKNKPKNIHNNNNNDDTNVSGTVVPVQQLNPLMIRKDEENGIVMSNILHTSSIGEKQDSDDEL
eukprot:gene9741-13107_t